MLPVFSLGRSEWQLWWRREKEKESERKEREREREQRMQQIFSESMFLHAAVLRVCRHCTDRDINFTEEREHTHMRVKEKMREQGSRFFFLPLF